MACSPLSVDLIPEDNHLTQECIALPFGASEHLVQIQHWDFFYGEWGDSRMEKLLSNGGIEEKLRKDGPPDVLESVC
ncbi:MAG TPA: hypothetical protein VLQ80_20310, partial [Candidatus Saccharimonadia bacterium]|nr:hypothetical protein [Candidatus Saccharimonadia bacterium]